MKRNKGITLIALVITIIVLLILAGVAISMLSGENGILRKAAEAKTKTEEAQKQESTTLLDMEIDGHFIEKGSKYKCRYGFITGFTIEKINNELRVTDTIKQLEDSLPAGYKVTLKYNTNDKKDEEITNKDENITTGMVVTKDGKIIARTIIFGDIDGDGAVKLSDYTALGRFIGINKLEDLNWKEAMDVNHDGFVNEDDYKFLGGYLAERKDVILDQYKYAQNINKDVSIISDNEIINNMDICDKDNFKQAYNDVDNYTYYEINLNKTYSYKELSAKIKEVDTSYKVEFYDSNIENEISSSSEETIKSGEWILISIDKIIKGTSIPENDHIYLKVK